MSISTGIVFAAFTALIAVIWNQLDKRIAAIELNAKSDRTEANKILDGIFCELRSINTSITDTKLHALENFTTKAECQRNHS